MTSRGERHAPLRRIEAKWLAFQQAGDAYGKPSKSSKKIVSITATSENTRLSKGATHPLTMRVIFSVYDPNKGAAAGGNLSAFNGLSMFGTWKFCAGDSGSGDTGAIQQVRLSFLDLPVLQISPKTVDFGGVVQGTTSVERFVTLANVGTADLTVNSLTVAMAPFQRTVDGTCGNSLPHSIPVGEQCTLGYTLAPATQDAVFQSFTVDSSAIGDTSFTLNGSGDAVFVDGFEP